MVSVPFTNTEPDRDRSMPMIARSVVVLPAPFLPSNVTTSPSVTPNFIPWRMCDSPYFACRASISRTERPALCMDVPHIRGQHLLAARDVAVVALREHLPPRQNRDDVGNSHNDRQVVLDEHHCAVRNQSPDQVCNQADVLVTHSGSRLVEQQHLRVERQRCRDLQSALAAVRQLYCGFFRVVRQSDGLDQLRRPRVQERQRTLRLPKMELRTGVAL